MARTVGKLSALKVVRLAKPGMHADGAGLYLQITGTGAKSWLYRFSLNGRAREMGLGSLSAVSLSEAREAAARCRRARQDGVDPIEARKADQARARLDAAKAITFSEAAAQYIEANRSAWRNAKHAAQWDSTLKRYVAPVFGSLPVQGIDVALVLKVIEPIWSKKPETAGRVRGRIETILDWATARGLRSGENPARWRGHLDKLLPKLSKVRAVKHHAALPYDQMPSFMVALAAQDGTAARALEFAILTAGRTGEVIGASWPEIDDTEAAWTIDGNRMKAGKDHRVPLSPRAVALLKRVKEEPGASNEFVFPGGKSGRPLSNMAMAVLLDRMKYDAITVHGFRSTFRDWAAERTSFPNEVVEMALAHAVGDKTEAAYRRGDLFEKRRRLMAEWAKFCSTPVAAKRDTVVPIRA
ncbi:tyrosine-type recombinase/integrase [Tardiphaga sp. 42S5]|uniref:tyrosine-type recombinase/integrase n=1 Tax=Tardiphaga sp. 42S5 TaxID=1404799 RepID=UPI002A5AF5FB|nr:integrase arm-type DNA-binding domain-containing protein [Tardiphaga sp. 42S5]WPO42520.1 integrase arm-type DNA-binding domain-containing protein [Tardiphaga sp. 42S5]